MKKPLPEEFGLTRQEYASLAAEREQLREAIGTQPSGSDIWIDAVVLGVAGR